MDAEHGVVGDVQRRRGGGAAAGRLRPGGDLLRLRRLLRERPVGGAAGEGVRGAAGPDRDRDEVRVRLLYERRRAQTVSGSCPRPGHRRLCAQHWSRACAGWGRTTWTYTSCTIRRWTRWTTMPSGRRWRTCGGRGRFAPSARRWARRSAGRRRARRRCSRAIATCCTRFITCWSRIRAGRWRTWRGSEARG